MPMNEFLKKLSLLNIETISKTLVFNIVRFWRRNNILVRWKKVQNVSPVTEVLNYTEGSNSFTAVRKGRGAILYPMI